MSGYGSLKKLKFIILKLEIKLEDITNGVLDKTNSVNILDILNIK